MFIYKLMLIFLDFSIVLSVELINGVQLKRIASPIYLIIKLFLIYNSNLDYYDNL